MAVIPTPEQGKPILDFSEGIFDGSSYLFQSRNGATEHVNGDAVADYVNTSRVYNTLDTELKTTVGAINEIKAQEESDIADVQTAIDGINSTDAPLFYKGTYTYTAASVAAGASLNISRSDFDITNIDGYTPISMQRIGLNKAGFVLLGFNVDGRNSVLGVANNTNATIANTTFTIQIIFVKSNFLKELT